MGVSDDDIGQFVWLCFCGCCVLLLCVIVLYGCEGKNLLVIVLDVDKLVMLLVVFQLCSMLCVLVMWIECLWFLVIDVYMYLSWMCNVCGVVLVGEVMIFFIDLVVLLLLMECKGIWVMVNFIGGIGCGLEEIIVCFDCVVFGCFFIMIEFLFDFFVELDYLCLQVEVIEQVYCVGVCGLKLFKILGLYLCEGIDEGVLVGVDDVCFDLMWEICVVLDMLVFIYMVDLFVFFWFIDCYNECYEELVYYLDWLFYGLEYFSYVELIVVCDWVIVCYLCIIFVLMYVGSQVEELDIIEVCLECFLNVLVDISVWIVEFGCQLWCSWCFFECFQDCILFGIDVVLLLWGEDVLQQLFGDELYEIYY